jgi:hypothetical protein
MRAKLTLATIFGFVPIALCLLSCVNARAQQPEMKLRAYLVWGTDDDKLPEGKNYKPVEPDIAKKLKGLPLKFKHYFEVSRTDFRLEPNVIKKVPVSEKCALEVKSSGNANVEVALFGKGKEAARQKQPLPKDETLVVSGNAPNSTAWLVVLKRLD